MTAYEKYDEFNCRSEISWNQNRDCSSLKQNYQVMLIYRFIMQQASLLRNNHRCEFYFKASNSSKLGRFWTFQKRLFTISFLQTESMSCSCDIITPISITCSLQTDLHEPFPFGKECLSSDDDDNNNPSSWARTLVLWLWEKTHVPKVVGLNPSTVDWMDIFSHLFVVKFVMFVWKDKNKWKRCWGWPIF